MINGNPSNQDIVGIAAPRNSDFSYMKGSIHLVFRAKLSDNGCGAVEVFRVNFNHNAGP
jgi:hypothetical protein